MDLRKYRVIKKVCEIYADKTAGWQAYYSDQWRWRKADPDLNAEVESILKSGNLDRPNNSRPRNDEGDKSWQADYCKALIDHKMALDKAASVTPYSIRQIEDFLDPVCSSYDEEFTKMVKESELTFSSRAREMLVDSLSPDAYETFEASKSTQTKVWVATKVLEKLEPKKFGRKQIEVTGTIDHRHQHRLMPRDQKFAMLQEDRRLFLERRKKEILRLNPLNQNESEEPPIEAEVVEEVESAEVESNS